MLFITEVVIFLQQPMHANKIDCGRERVKNTIMAEACVNISLLKNNTECEELELEVMLKCD